jgi:hypothetical protein
MPSPIVELLADLSSALATIESDWYLFGAQAALLHGVTRLTNDVDVTVRLAATQSSQAFVAVLEAAGFQPRFEDQEFIAQTRVIPFTHRVTALPLDVVLSGPGIEDLFFERVEWRDLEGLRVPIASPEDLVVMKILAGRAKDIDDVVAIVAAYLDRLNTPYVEGMLAQLEEALAQSDLLPAFRAAEARAKRIREQ